MGWSWLTFIIAFPLITWFSMFSRGAMNAANMAKHGLEADWRHDVGGAMLGCAIAGAIYASLLAIAVGTFF